LLNVVKKASVIIFYFAKLKEILRGKGAFVCEEIQDDLASRCVEQNSHDPISLLVKACCYKSQNQRARKWKSQPRKSKKVEVSAPELGAFISSLSSLRDADDC
jgi:hypothetical protein